MNVSVIVPVYNEEDVLERSIHDLHAFLQRYDAAGAFEILICNNGSTDRTLARARDLAVRLPHIRVYSISNKALGDAIRLGIQQSRYEYVAYEAIDIPFGLDSIRQSIEHIRQGYDIVIRSKGHPRSEIHIPFRRRAFSRLYNRLLNFFFHTGISDTQGEWIIKKDILNNFLHITTANGAFFQTQIFLYGRHFTKRIIEIPVSYTNPRTDSKMTAGNAVRIVWNLLKEIPRYHRFRSNNE